MQRICSSARYSRVLVVTEARSSLLSVTFSYCQKICSRKLNNVKMQYIKKSVGLYGMRCFILYLYFGRTCTDTPTYSSVNYSTWRTSSRSRVSFSPVLYGRLSTWWPSTKVSRTPFLSPQPLMLQTLATTVGLREEANNVDGAVDTLCYSSWKSLSSGRFHFKVCRREVLMMWRDFCITMYYVIWTLWSGHRSEFKGVGVLVLTLTLCHRVL